MHVPRRLCFIAAFTVAVAVNATAQETEDRLRREVESLKQKDAEKDRQIQALEESLRKIEEELRPRQEAQLHEADPAPLSQEVERYNTRLAGTLPVVDLDGNPLSEVIAALRLSMQARTRVEYHRNLTDFNSHRDDEFVFAPYRFRLGVGADITENLGVYMEAQTNGFAGDQDLGDRVLPLGVPGGPVAPFGPIGQTSVDNELQPYQGYLRWGNFLGDEDTSVQIGRQEMVYGTEFLVGDSDFYLGQSFDGIRISRRNEDYDAHVWATRIVENDVARALSPPGTADEDVNFYGVYFTWKQIEDTNLDLYWMWLQDHESTMSLFNPGRGTDERHTFGARLGGTFADGYFDYNAEFALQFGDSKTVAGQRQNINHANGLEAWLGYSFRDLDWTPWIALKYVRASGDNRAGDSNDKTFNPLFQDVHNRYGNADLFRFTNLQGLGALFRMQPCEGVTFGANYWYFLVDEQRDPSGPLFAAAGVPSGDSRSIADEIDLYVHYDWSRYARIGVNWSHLFSRNYVDNQTGRKADDADRLYLNVDVRF
jgi:hypothetical protein